MTDNNIQRYDTSEMYNIRETCMGRQFDGKWVKHKDHLKAMEAKDIIVSLAKSTHQEQERLSRKRIEYKDQTIAEQAKEIEQLKELNKDLLRQSMLEGTRLRVEIDHLLEKNENEQRRKNKWADRDFRPDKGLFE